MEIWRQGVHKLATIVWALSERGHGWHGLGLGKSELRYDDDVCRFDMYSVVLSQLISGWEYSSRILHSWLANDCLADLYSAYRVASGHHGCWIGDYLRFYGISLMILAGMGLLHARQDQNLTVAHSIALVIFLLRCLILRLFCHTDIKLLNK